jgi:hypothetical protein
VISPSDPSSAWTAKANKARAVRIGLNYLIDVEHAIIVDVEATPARTYDEVASTRTMIERTESTVGMVKIPKRSMRSRYSGKVADSERPAGRTDGPDDG